MIMIGNRNDVVSTLGGFSIGFKAGEETYVPDDIRVIKACLDRGHTQKQEAQAEEPLTLTKPKKAKFVEVDPEAGD